MKVEFYHHFNKDLLKTRDKNLAKIIIECIELFEKASDINDIPNLKKLKGHPTAWRYRKGKYRIGFYFEDNIVKFAAFAPRGHIYKIFP